MGLLLIKKLSFLPWILILLPLYSLLKSLILKFDIVSLILVFTNDFSLISNSFFSLMINIF